MGNTVIQMRNDTSSNWSSDNPVLALGEMGLETDNERIKFGDGTTAWNSLPYFGAQSFKYGLYTLSSDQTSNLAAGNHIEYNTCQGSLGGLSTGLGQANGIITLPAGKTYKITGDIGSYFSSAGWLTLQLYDRTNNQSVGFFASVLSTTYANNTSSTPIVFAIITPLSNIDIDLRIINSGNPANIISGRTWLLIEEYGGY